MNNNHALSKQKQTIARLERDLALQKIKKRKAETRRKIELGGLVIKAHMENYPKIVILGALIDAFEALQKDSAIKILYQSKGEAAFMGY